MPARRRLLPMIIVAAVALLVGCGTNPTTLPPPPTRTSAVTATPTPTTVIVAPSSTSATPVSAEASCLASTMAKLSLRQLVGQVLMIAMPLDNPGGTTALINTYHPGGVFLAGRSQQSAASLRSQIAALQTAAGAGSRLLISLDQEGGEVQTLQGPDFPPIPTAVDQGRLSQAALRSQTMAWARRLAQIGVNLDLAPVADTVPASIGTGNPPIGAYEREYGSEPDAVAGDVATVVGAIQSTGVQTTIKHFPGLGRVRQNTDTSAAAVDSLATTHDPYLAPFVAGIHGGTAAVMISLASYPNLDAHAIAAFSPAIVTKLLRQQLGFTGLIVSDDLGAATAVSGVAPGQRAVRFIQAGGDLVLTVDPATVPAMFSSLLTTAQSSTTFAKQVTAAARYVLQTRYRTGELACSPRP